MSEERHDPSLRSLLSDIFARLTVLLRKELDLARSEVSQNLSRATVGAVLILVGAVFAISALNVLAVAAVIALQSNGMELVWATLTIGVGGLVLAVILAAIGARRLKPSALAPSRTEREMRRNVETVKEVFDA